MRDSWKKKRLLKIRKHGPQSYENVVGGIRRNVAQPSNLIMLTIEKKRNTSLITWYLSYIFPPHMPLVDPINTNLKPKQRS